ncbi:MAG TPA: Uma2 family endonuclease [Candidatus Competibacter sp.]|nr:Uma2 family endonuclease [Candidatus Competibacteraceae bacterium]HPE72752.1 Uma2 family endonuclease [Candidatus Competibacter sp.]HRW65075.1 Uma2 family endonuclease [Candidatus Competibacter sp.]
MSTPLAERELLNAQPRHRWTVAEYHRMAEVGLSNEDSRVELIDGEIIEMAPIASEHAEQQQVLQAIPPTLGTTVIGNRGEKSRQQHQRILSSEKIVE